MLQIGRIFRSWQISLSWIQFWCTEVGEHSIAYGRTVSGKSVRTNLLKRSFGCIILYPPSLLCVELNFPYAAVQMSIPLTDKFNVFQSKFRHSLPTKWLTPRYRSVVFNQFNLAVLYCKFMKMSYCSKVGNLLMFLETFVLRRVFLIVRKCFQHNMCCIPHHSFCISFQFLCLLVIYII